MKAARRISLCSMLCALGVVLLWVGAVTDLLDITFSVVASLIIVFAMIELKGSAPFLIYLVTGILSLILLPSKFAAAVYLAYSGIYPILKSLLERKIKSGIVCFIIKTVYFIVVLVGMILLSKYVFLINDGAGFELAAFAIGLAGMELYDFTLTRLISLYFYKLRKKLRVERLLK